ncbi:MAG: hypothetical protein QOJ27_2658, partial [Sphingomonadales bacterium]|nr:hypothetical protein [Sphingomonadales bacterium]
MRARARETAARKLGVEAFGDAVAPALRQARHPAGAPRPLTRLVPQSGLREA